MGKRLQGNLYDSLLCDRNIRKQGEYMLAYSRKTGF